VGASLPCHFPLPGDKNIQQEMGLSFGVNQKNIQQEMGLSFGVNQKNIQQEMGLSFGVNHLTSPFTFIPPEASSEARMPCLLPLPVYPKH
jgi:hypothetical protein